MFTRLPQWLSGKKSLYTAGDVGSIPGLGRSPGEGNGNLFQYSCKENSMGRRACWVTVHGVSGWGHIKVHQYNWKKRKPQRQKEPYNQGTCECVVFWCWTNNISHIGLLWWLRGKESTCQCKGLGFDPWVRKIPWRRKWQPTPVFLPGKSHRQRSLVGYSLSGCKRIGHNLVTKQHSSIKTTHYF